MIEYNDGLASLEGLSGLESVGGDLSIKGNLPLSTLLGLESLSSIGGSLSVSSNLSLTTLSGLDNIDAGTITDLTINSNTSLNTCEVLSICNYLASPNGTILITNNANGCNNEEEVEEACVWVGIDEQGDLELMSIYPNPAQSAITIELPVNTENNINLTISNTSGQEVIKTSLSGLRAEINISHLPVGIYIVKAWNNSDVTVRKIVKE